MKRVISLFVSFVFILSVFSVQVTGLAVGLKEAYGLNSINYQQIALSFTPTDSAMDTQRPVVYMSDKANKKLYAVNYETGSISSISFTLMPESIYYYNNEIYVSLMTREHDYYWWTENQTGAIAIIDAATFTLKEQFDIALDPFDIVVDNGYIYVSSGSGQWTKMNSYLISTKTKASSIMIDHRSYIKMNSQLSRIYAVDTTSSPRDIWAFLFNNGVLNSYYNSPYHGDYSLGTSISISPDGKYVFNNSGNVFTCDADKAKDMKFYGTLNQGYNDIAFNLNNDCLYIADSQSIINYTYSTLTRASSIAANGTIKNLFYSADKNKLVTVFSKTAGSVTTYYVEAVDPPKSIETLVMEKIEAIPATVALSDKYAIANARKAYDALSESKKLLVTNYNKLLTAETAIKPLMDAETQSVIDLINALPVSVLAQNKPQIQNARTAYEALLPVQKALITNYAKLLETENKLADLIGYPQVQLSFTPADSAMDADRPVVYLSDKAGKKLYAVNYVTGNVSYISFDLMPESLYYSNNELYVCLLSGPHDSYSMPSGTIAVVDANTFSVKESFKLTIDPYDIVADKDYIYISCGSNQWTTINSYSKATKAPVSFASIRQASYIDYNAVLNKIYTITTDSSPRDISAYSINNGVFSSYYDSPYHGDYSMGTGITVSPDGKYIFNDSGNIFTNAAVQANDMKFYGSLNQGYNSIAFNLNNDSLYIADSQSIINYNYSSLSRVSSITANGTIKKLFYSEERNKLVTVFSKTVNSVQSYYVETIDPPKNAETLVIEKIASLPQTVALSDKYAIADARTAYDSLSESKKLLITNYKKLLAAETAVKPLMDTETQTVIDLIDALPVSVSSQDKTKIQDARKAYDLLLPVQKILITNYAKLLETENKLANLIGYPQIQLSFAPADSAMDTDRPVVYLSDKANKKLYAVNYVTGGVSYISFDLMPESLYYYNNDLYVSLMSGEHTSYGMPSGAIAIVDANTFSLKSRFNISIDPFDIVVDNGYIYVSSGSAQWTTVNSYSIATKSPISSSFIRQASYIKMHPTLSRLYAVDTDSSPRDIETHIFNNGVFTSTYDSPYHGDYGMGTGIALSPDGKYVFNNSGNIFTCDAVKANDIKYVRNVGQSYSDVAFNLSVDTFYVASAQTITQYRYSDFSIVSTKSANGNIKNLYYSQERGKLITVYSKTVNNVLTYYVEAVGAPKNAEVVVIEKIDNLPEMITLDDKSLVLEARKAYDSLTLAQKELVTNYDKLLAAETAIAELEKQEEANYIFDESTGTIYGYTGTCTNLYIPSQINGITVKAIGAFAFGASKTLNSVYIPDTVTEIGEMAFLACESLTKVTLPNKLDKIGDMAFAGCASLASINSPSSVSTLGSGILMGCAFTSPVLFESNKTLVFVPQSITNYTIPSTVTKIGGMAFYMCMNLSYISVPSSVTTIGDMAFGGCVSLTNISIPNTVTTFGMGILLGTSISSPVIVQSGKTLIYVPFNYSSYSIPNAVTKIGGMAFFMNENLTGVTIPTGVTEIGEMAFAECTSLTSLSIPGTVKTIGASAFGGCTSLASLNIQSGVTTIGSGAFSGCSSLAGASIPSSVTTIGDGAFSDCSSLTSIYIPNTVTTVGMGILAGTAIANPVIVNNGKTLIYVPSDFTRYNIPNGVTRIEGLAFIENSALTAVTIPNSVTTIGYGAFGYCTSLTQVIIPSSVTTLEERAFSDCYSLTKILIPDSVTTFGYEVFGSCDYLTICGKAGGTAEAYANENSIPFAVVGDDGFAFNAENGTIAGYFGSSASLVIPPQIGGFPVTAIADYAFENNAVLTSVSIPNTVTKIGTNAFYNCSNLSAISIPSTLTDFGYNPFGGTAWQYNYVGDFVVVNGILLNYKGAGGKVTVPSTVKVIGQGAFFGNDTILTVSIPSSVTSIGYGAFGYCTYLSEVVIAEGATTIEDRAFSDCYSLTRILIPNSVTSIGLDVFDFVSQFTICGKAGGDAEVYAAKNEIPFATVGNDGFAFNAENGTIAGYFGTSKSLVIPSQIDGVPVKAIGDFAFEYSDITSITIPNTVTKIGIYSFSNCTDLANINFASSVVDFGYCAFENSLWLQNYPGDFVVVNGILIKYKGNESIITIPNNVKVIGDWVFSENTTITKVIIPNGVTTIGVGAFADCINLSEISVAASVTEISDWAFANTAWLNNNTDEFVILNGFLLRYNGTAAEVNIPDGVKTISSYAFAGCDTVTSIYIPNTVTKMGEGAFVGCTALKIVNISVGIKSIDSYMFMYCFALESVIIPDSVDSIAEDSFIDCPDVTIYCKDGSYAKSYAEALKIWYIIIPPPTITIGDYNHQNTNGEITVTASADYGILNAESHTFTENGSFEFVVTDLVGNVTKQTVTITNIVKYTKGDINGDGGIDALDLLKLKKNLLGQESLSATSTLAADINGDNTVDALDLLQLRKYLLGQITL